jgi:UDP-hydrolysing UDP-N-acetyl-D-glucosamine 2-epimerase
MSSSKRKICVLTGSRAEYGLLRSLLTAIQNHPKLQLQLVVTGSHLIRQMGNTIQDIEHDRFEISAKIPMYKSELDSRKDLPESLGRLTGKLGTWLIKNNSDVLVVLGDRLEALGGALAAMTANVPLAHLHGGELAAGDMDDRIRFAISSLSSIHLTATHEAKQRLIHTGETPKRIFVTGAIGLDEIYSAKKSFKPADRRELFHKYKFDDRKSFLIVLHHPCGFGASQEYKTMKELLSSVQDYQGIIIGPNNDPGHSGIRKAIKEFFKLKQNSSAWIYTDNLSRMDYLRAIWSADALVGNSSSGIIEVNSLGTAVVNIGPRQVGRQCNGNAVLHCKQNSDDISKKIQQAIRLKASHKIQPDKSFGSGNTGVLIAKILSEIPIDRTLLIKQRF